MTFSAKALVFLFVLQVVAMPAALATSRPERYERSVVEYTVPNVVLVNQEGKRVALKSLLGVDRPVVLDFIYGTCTTICPILSAGYSHLQRKLGDESEKVQLVSITIDPENDSPAVLLEYLEKYQAKPGWDFLTGSRSDIERVMNAFDAFFRDKMDHQPLTFIRSSDEGKWIRLYGLISSRDFMNELEESGTFK
jgi:protein SCO1/2